MTDLDRWLSISFNSRTLGRVRRSASCSGFGFLMFQFTHPGKGATRRCVVRRFQIYRFNSRTLGRVRHDYFLPAIGKLDVSIHAPWEGCDACRGKRAPLAKEVSIHAPWEGCDRRRQLSLSHSEGFNSRTLGRVRRRHRPHGRRCLAVSIHAPWEGCDIVALRRYPLRRGFNSRTLGRVRRLQARHFRQASCFNSRTLGRVRQCLSDLMDATQRFQFTHPGKGATSKEIPIT